MNGRRSPGPGVRGEGHPGAVTGAGDGSWPKPFAIALALYVCVILGRLHEAVPFLAPFYPGKISAALLIGAAFVHAAQVDFSTAFRSRIAKCFIVISLIGIASVPGSSWPRQSVAFLQGQWPQALLMLVCVVAGFSDRRTAKLTIVCLFIASALGALQLVIGAGLIVDGRSYIGGSSQTYDPNLSAAFFVMVLPYAMMFATRPGKMRWVGMVMIPTLMVAMVKTGSRGGFIALTVVFLAMLVTSTKRQRKAYVMLAAVAAVSMVLAPHADLLSRLKEVFSGTDYNYTSRGGRLEVWKAGIKLIFTHPVLGVGIGAYEAANATKNATWATAHNTYIQIGGELGFGGLAAFLYAIRLAFQSALGLRKVSAAPAGARESEESFDHALATASICSLVAVLTAAFFLSMAYEAMTLFALAVPTGLVLHGVRQASGRVVAVGFARQPGWRSAASQNRPRGLEPIGGVARAYRRTR